MSEAYAGIGSRKTPGSVGWEMTRIAARLRALGFILRSGRAAGADAAFERGAGTDCEIYRPKNATPESIELASRYHPAWERCNENARKLHGRNPFQVLGRDLKSPSRFVVCWTSDGKASGGTGLAMRIAEAHGIPIFNMHDPLAIPRLADWLRGNGYPVRQAA